MFSRVFHGKFKNRKVTFFDDQSCLIFSKPGWLGHASGCIYFKPSTGCVDFNLIKSEDLSVAKVLSSANESTFSKPCAMFSDGVHIGVIVVDVNDRFTVKFLNACNCSSVESELPLKLARKSIDVFGSSIIEEGKTKHQVDFASDDDVLSLQSGKEFALMLTSHGRIYYTGTYQKMSFVAKNSIKIRNGEKFVKVCCPFNLTIFLTNSNYILQENPQH